MYNMVSGNNYPCRLFKHLFHEGRSGQLSRRVLGLIMCAAFFVVIPDTAAENSDTTEMWIDVIRTIEKQVQVLEYTVECKQFKANSQKELIDPKPTGLNSKAHILIENDTGRSYVDCERLVLRKEPDGSISENFISNHAINAFDGETVMGLNYFGTGEGGSKIGQYSPEGRGTIGGDFDDIPDKGLDIFPSFFQGKRLSEIVENADQVKFVEKEGGILEVNYLKQYYESRQYGSWRKCTLDLSKGGILTQTQGYHLLDGDSKQYPFDTIDVEYIQSPDGRWVPSSATRILAGIPPHTIYKFTYKDVGINHVRPDIQKFRIQFPDETLVLDRRTGYVFTVGGGEGVEKVIDDFLDELTLQLSEAESESVVQTASQKPTASVELKPAPEIQPEPKSQSVKGTYEFAQGVWIVPVAVIALGLLILIYRFVSTRKPPHKTLMLLLVSAILIAYQISPADTIDTNSSDSDYYWQVTVADQEIPVFQCGFNVVFFTLRFFEMSCSSEAIRSSMSPGPVGISLLDLRNVLKGYGLDVWAQQGVQPQDLNKVFASASKRLVILPTDISGASGHYFIILPAKRNSANEYLLIDIARWVKNQSEETIGESLNKVNGTVLIVSQSDRPRLHSDLVKIQPESLDFGSINRADINKQQLKQLTIVNTSDKPVMVDKIGSSCACSTVDYKGGLLQPKEEKTVSVFLYPADLHEGESQNKIAMHFGDGSKKVVTVKAQVLSPEIIQGLEISPKKFYFEIGPGSSTGKDFIKTLYVSNQGPKSQIPFTIDTSDSAAWLSTDIVAQPRDNFPGRVKVQVLPSAIQAQEAGSQFLIYSDPAKDPVIVPIHVAKSPFYTVSSRLVVFSSTADQNSATVLVKPYGAESKFVKVTETSSAPPLTVTASNNTESGMSTVTIKPVGNLPGKELYKVNLTLQSSTGEKMFETIRVVFVAGHN